MELVGKHKDLGAIPFLSVFDKYEPQRSQQSQLLSVQWVNEQLREQPEGWCGDAVVSSET